MKSNLMCKVTRGALCALGLSAAIYAAPLYGQGTAGASSGLGSATVAPTPSDDIIELSPFEIVTSADSYKNPAATVATRIAVPIIDTPYNLTVIGEAQIRDIGIQEFTDAFAYTAGVTVDVPASDTSFRASLPIRIRGFSTGRILRNGFRRYYQQNLDGVDRVQVVRGPLGSFFGYSEPGGVIDYVTKRPEYKWKHNLKAQYGSYEFKKLWLDTQGIIIPDKFAYRIVSTLQESDSWKQYNHLDRSYFLGTLNFKPFKSVTINLEYEYNEQMLKGGRDTALIANTDYLADYDYWQSVARKEDWRQFYRSANSSSDPLGNFVYNVNFFTRYPTDYSDIPGAAAQLRKWPQFLWVNGQPTYPDNRPSVDPATDYQWPILEMSSAFGSYNLGQTHNLALQETVSFPQANANTIRQYRHGWRTLTWLDSLGLYDRNTNRFVRNDNIMPYYDAQGVLITPDIAQQEDFNGEYVPGFTGQAYPKGKGFNPNGPTSYASDVSHTAAGDITIKPENLEWLTLRYSFNYYENVSKGVRPYNSDTDQDGYTLDVGQGFVVNRTATANGINFTPSNFTGFFSRLSEYNRYQTHQVDINFNFEFAGAKHNILFSGEYRDDVYKNFNSSPTQYYIDRGANNTPGFTIWDIRYDQPPSIGDIVELGLFDGARFGTGNASQEQGYTAVYRGEFWEDRIGIWAGLRHENRRNWTINRFGDRAGAPGRVSGTTPTYGVTFEITKGLKLYASYSESLIAPGGANNPLNPKPDFAVLDRWAANQPLAPDDYVPWTRPDNIKGMGYEAGVKFELFDTRLVGTIAAFHVEKDGILTTNRTLMNELQGVYDAWYLDRTQSNPNVREVDVGTITFNGGKEVIEGFEAEIIYTPEWLNGLELTSGFSWFVNRDRENIDSIDMFGDIRSSAPGEGDGPAPHPSQWVWDPLYGPNDTLTGTPTGGYRPKTVAELDNDRRNGVNIVYPNIAVDTIPNVSEFTFNMWAKYTFGKDTPEFLEGFKVGLGYRFQSKAYIHNTIQRAYMQPAHHVFDGLISYGFDINSKMSMDISLNVRNIFDKQYIQGAFGLTDPRTVTLTASLSF